MYIITFKLYEISLYMTKYLIYKERKSEYKLLSLEEVIWDLSNPTIWDLSIRP